MKRTTLGLVILATTVAISTATTANAAGRRGFGRYGGVSGYGTGFGRGYGGVFGGLYMDDGIQGIQSQALHESQMNATMKYAPIPQLPGAVTNSSTYNPYWKNLDDDYYGTARLPSHPETIENPFVHPNKGGKFTRRNPPSKPGSGE